MYLANMGAGRNGHTAFLQSKEDLDWLFNVHLQGKISRADIHSAIIVGNEDSPNLIEIYSTHDPKFRDEPIFSIRDE